MVGDGLAFFFQVLFFFSKNILRKLFQRKGYDNNDDNTNNRVIMWDLLFKKPLVSIIQSRQGQDLNTWPGLWKQPCAARAASGLLSKPRLGLWIENGAARWWKGHQTQSQTAGPESRSIRSACGSLGKLKTNDPLCFPICERGILVLTSGVLERTRPKSVGENTLHSACSVVLVNFQVKTKRILECKCPTEVAFQFPYFLTDYPKSS